MNGAELLLMKGNEAIGEAAVRGGCRHFFGYPITPQSEVLEYLSGVCRKSAALMYRLKAKYRPSTWFLGQLRLGAAS